MKYIIGGILNVFLMPSDFLLLGSKKKERERERKGERERKKEGGREMGERERESEERQGDK